MHQIRREIEVSAPADVTWAIVGDAGAIADWAPTLATSRLEGDVRYGTMPDGTAVVERIIRHSDAERSYSYIITDAPFALEGYESTIQVQELGERSLVVWSAQFEADDALRDAVDGMYGEGLISLAQHVEASIV